jgi:hypothetical protein
MKKNCFSIMPYGDAFQDIDRIIHKAAESVGLEYVRGDLSKRPGSILAQIVQEIKHSTVVVADITGNNPNVFYELGIAHQILGPDRVILITQSVNEKQPYDIHQFRQLVYSHTNEGRQKLNNELPDRLTEAANSNSDLESWRVIRGRLSRTKMIVGDLNKIIKGAGKERLNGLIIRIVAGLGSLSISNYEPADPQDDHEYINALLEERDKLREALLRGARLKAVINPPRRFAHALIPARLCIRYQRIIGLLQGRSDITDDPKSAQKDMTAMRQCEFTLSPVPMPNLFIIGEIIAYEGMKRGGGGGFEMTHWETDKAELHQLIDQFDSFFEDSKRDMKHIRPPDGCIAQQLQEFYDEATNLERRRRHNG